MRRPRLELAIERFEPRQDAPEPDDRVHAVGGPTAVRRLAEHVHFDPREAFVADGNGQVRSVR
jgi:hypothetical protein